MTRKHMPQAVKKELLDAAARGESLDTMASVVEKFIRSNGGTSGLAKMLKLEYDEAKPGSLLRQRILDMILRTWKFVDEKYGSNALDDMGSIDDEDLDRLIAEKLQGMSNGQEESAGREHTGPELGPEASAGGTQDSSSAAASAATAAAPGTPP